MSGFDQFASKKKSNNGIFDLIQNTVSASMNEMGKSASKIISVPSTKETGQISSTTERYEQSIKQKRSPL